MTDQADATHKRRRFRITLPTAILIGMALGIACGLFFGEYCSALQPVGDAFIGLLQMTVLPYITLALIVNIGGLTFEQARELAVKAILVLLALWAVGIIAVLVLPMGFPDLVSASFFSTSMLQHPQSIDYLRLYIPANPFYSLANTLIPGVVLFAIAVGIALIGVREKESLIRPLKVFIDALTRINVFIAKLTPLGVFALAASAAGTLTTEQLGRLQAYLIVYIASALLLALWVLPALVAAFTPFSYRDIVRKSRAPLITAFALDNIFVVLPQLIQAAKELFQEYDHKRPDVDRSIDVLVPVAYTMPHLGKLLTMVFVPFAAWFVGDELTAWQYPAFVFSGLLSYFGHTTVAVPFLLDLMQLPADMFNLFILANIFTGRFGALLGGMNLLALAVLTTCLLTGLTRRGRTRFLRDLAVTVVIAMAVIVSTRAYLARAMAGAYKKDEIIRTMQLLEDPAEDVTVLDEPSPNPDPLRRGQSRLERIRERGVIRIGYKDDFLPFAYFSSRDGMKELVGFDIEMAHKLAQGLGVGIEFVPFEIETMARQIEADHFDVVMSGIAGSISRYEQMRFTDSYLDVTPAVVVKDHERRRFNSIEKIQAMTDVRVGAPNDPYMLRLVRETMPTAEIVPLDTPRPFFEGEVEDLRCLFEFAEFGAAWTLLYPGYSVVILREDLDVKWPLAYPMAAGDEEFAVFMNRWIDLQKKNGSIKLLYDHWILGRTAEKRGPRWSVIRDVLHWVD